jgi:proteic killer suppression protein
MTILSFKDKRTETLYRKEQVKGFAAPVRPTLRKLRILDAVHALEQLNTPPGNRLEQLKGDRAGQHSIRINDQWRICFVWTDKGPVDVEVCDYH